MNEIYNFNPDDKRMRLAALLQDQTPPYRKYSGPLGASTSAGDGGMKDLMMRIAMQKMNETQRGAPVVDRSIQYDPSSQNFTPSY